MSWVVHTLHCKVLISYHTFSPSASSHSTLAGFNVPSNALENTSREILETSNIIEQKHTYLTMSCHGLKNPLFLLLVPTIAPLKWPKRRTL